MIKEDSLKEESKVDASPLLVNRAEQLTDTVEALQNIAGSSYWKVLEKNVFAVELAKARRSLVKENDTTEIYRLQGEIRSKESFSLEKLLEKYRNELTTIKSKL